MSRVKNVRGLFTLAVYGLVRLARQRRGPIVTVREKSGMSANAVDVMALSVVLTVVAWAKAPTAADATHLAVPDVVTVRTWPDVPIASHVGNPDVVAINTPPL